MRLHLHILRAHAGPFAFSFVTIMFVFLLQFVMKFIDQLVGKGLGFVIIGELIVLNVAWIVVLAVPMSVLVATLMAFGSLSSQHEITAMKAGGVSLYRMILPVLLASGLLTYLMIGFNNTVLPEANHRLKTLIIDIRRIKPTLTITQGLFSQELQGYSILARRTYEYTNDLEGLTIFDYTDPATNVVVTAREGRVSFTPDYRRLVMDLRDGEIHQMRPSEPEPYRRMRFERHRIIMNAEGFDFERSGENAFSRGDRELSAPEMVQIVDSLERSVREAHLQALDLVDRASAVRTPAGAAGAAGLDSAELRRRAIALALSGTRTAVTIAEGQILSINYNRSTINQYLVEIHKKYAIPFACVVFVLIGAPLGVMARRGTFGVAASLSLGFFVLYWASLIAGEKLADRGLLSPWLGMWMADIVLFVLGAWLTVRMGRESPTINWAALRRLVPAYFRAPEPEEGAGG